MTIPSDRQEEIRKLIAERRRIGLALTAQLNALVLRITEDVAGKRNCIIIPGTGLKDFQKLLAEMVSASDEIPPNSGSLPGQA